MWSASGRPRVWVFGVGVGRGQHVWSCQGRGEPRPVSWSAATTGNNVTNHMKMKLTRYSLSGQGALFFFYTCKNIYFLKKKNALLCHHSLYSLARGYKEL